ncbi:DNA gyrase subunit A, partial [Candidatus Parcubacteria bacterium]|nr:DNA gyrase subunit A [Candidatus Parcubacteria bacterium]
MPYQVNKAVLVTRIAQLVKDGKLGKIRGLRDESSDRDGMRIVIELKREARPQQVLNLLYKHTDMQKSFNTNIVGLVDGEPRVLTLKMLLEEFLRHRKQIIVNRTLYLLNKAKARAHILEGLKIALDHIDAVIETIKKSKTQEVAKVNLIKKFELTEIQATAILDMQLRRLAALERQKIEDELKEVLKAIAGLEALLASPKKIMGVVKTGLLEVKEKYGDKRRTKVFKQKAGEFAEEELIESQEVIVTLTKSGYIKRLPRTTYKQQGRGGKGVRGAKLKEEDIVEEMLTANTHDKVLFFTNKGKVYSLRIWDIPDASRTAKGVAIVNLINLEAGEKVNSILNVAATHASPKKFLIAATRKGTVKRTPIEQFENIRKTGIIAIKLAEDDELCWVKPTDGQGEVLLVGAKGKSIRFDENDARAMGRSAAGVRGIKLAKDDHIVGMEVIENLKNQSASGGSKLKSLLVVTKNGYGKLTKLEEYPQQKRGGSGVLTARVNEKTGQVVGGRLIVEREGDLVIVSTAGQVIRLP